MLSSAGCCMNTMADLSTAIAVLGWLLYIGQICGHIVDCADMVPKVVRFARKVGHFFANSFYVLAKLVLRPLVEAAQQVGATVAKRGRATHCRLASLFRSRKDASTQFEWNAIESGTQTEMHFCRCRGMTMNRDFPYMYT